MSTNTYVTPDQAARRLQFSPRYFREVIMKRHLLEGVHYVRAFHGRKYLVIWELVERELLAETVSQEAARELAIPMAAGGSCNV